MNPEETEYNFESFDVESMQDNTDAEIVTGENLNEVEPDPEVRGKLKWNMLVIFIIIILLGGVIFFLLNHNSNKERGLEPANVVTPKVQTTETGNTEKEGQLDRGTNDEKETKVTGEQAPSSIPKPGEATSRKDALVPMYKKEQGEVTVGSSKVFTATVTGKEIGSLDDTMSLFKITFVVDQVDGTSGPSMMAFLTRGSWESLNVGSTIKVTLCKDNNNRFVLDKIVLDK